MKKLSTILILSALVLVVAALYVIFVNPIKIDKACGSLSGNVCSGGFYCKMPQQSLGSTEAQGLCVPLHLALLPSRAFVFGQSK